MKTDVIKIYSDLKGHDAAADAVERFSAYHGITGKQAMHLRLLTEETISMVHGIMDDFSGSFWLESENTKKGLLCRICLSAEKQANKQQESQILSVSTSGKNENVKGIMGKIRELFRQSLQTEPAEDEAYLQRMADAWLPTGTQHNGLAASDTAFWSLQEYKQNMPKNQDAEEWDELEKSIIANFADEVKVWLKTDVTEIVIEKLLPKTAQ